MYRGESPLRDRLGDLLPWDVGVPQPFVVALDAAGEIGGLVLDAGCGRGDNALFLAGHGHRVVGFDGSPAAIQQASAAGRDRGFDIDFVVADATDLTAFAGRATTVVDSALYHCLRRDDRRRYAAELHRALRPGGRLHVVCFADAKVRRLDALNYIGDDELRDVFAAGWTTTRLTPTGYLTAFTRSHLAARAEAEGRDDVDAFIAETFDVDADGRILSPCWQLTAVRDRRRPARWRTGRRGLRPSASPSRSRSPARVRSRRPPSTPGGAPSSRSPRSCSPPAGPAGCSPATPTCGPP